MANTIEKKLFRDVPLNDHFFDSLKKDYKEFPDWYRSKAAEPAYVQYTDDKLTGFMYLKIEEGEVADVTPPLVSAKRIKIGTLKVEAHGTRLGERLIKKAFDHAVVSQAQEIYLTIFPHHKPLIAMLEEFGFREENSIKETENGKEAVFVKSLDHSKITGDIRKDYPLIETGQSNFYLLAIRPQYHSQLFPDSLLNTESYDLLSDISHTNSISKNYISAITDIERLRPKDILVIYRMKDDRGPAEYRSVATSICVVEELRSKKTFKNDNEFLTYAKPYSVFSETELRRWWTRPELFVIKMLYNAALTKRVIRKTLADDIGLDREAYWGFLPLSREQFLSIVNRGGVDGRLIIR
ncbi:MAG TPA: GNAT family N-acetyltransferase [Dehalococcoidales bacterium]|nr:GNAT family N-acetyltransferase [Dehalococcoidales bacterium]